MPKLPSIDTNAIKGKAASAAQQAAQVAQSTAKKGAVKAKVVKQAASELTLEDVKSGASAVASGARDSVGNAYNAARNLTADDVKAAAASARDKGKDAAVDIAHSAADTAALLREEGPAGFQREVKRRGVFNQRLKKAALADLEEATIGYEQWICNLAESCEALHQEKVNAVGTLGDASAFVSSIANKPKEFETTLSDVEYEIKQFEDLVVEVQKLDHDWSVKSNVTAKAGSAAGAGMYAFGAHTAMAIATTFGTASTGTAISSLSGAAATNAAVAWLGGGTVAAGGGGMASGNALLGFLGGPAGWILAGAGLIAGTAIAAHGNAKVAAAAEANTAEIIVEVSKVKVANKRACLLGEEIEYLEDSIDDLVDELRDNAPDDYQLFQQHEKELLMALVNAARSLSAKINEAIE